jgi:hypothetical protein
MHAQVNRKKDWEREKSSSYKKNLIAKVIFVFRGLYANEKMLLRNKK